MTHRSVTRAPVPARSRARLPLAVALTGALAATLATGGAAVSSAAVDATPAPQDEPTSYVALGDSFSSGTGTRAKVDDCYRSPFGYPVLLADAHSLDLDYQACSGAVIADVHANQVQALGAGTDYVTMTIGGNDLGFADVITQCALPGWLSNCHGRINSSRELLHSQMGARYDGLFAEIGQRAPAADVVVGSYPRLFNGTDCNLATFFSGSEMAALNNATDELATVIQNRTLAAGFRYADPRPAFTGHAVCDSTEWVNGISWPIVESYHPNRAGNVGYADVFWPGTSALSTTSMTTSGTQQRSAAPGELSHAEQVRAQADAVLAMDLTSGANLRAARADGVSTGSVVRLVAQLRSGDTATVERALSGLRALDAAHAEAHQE